MSTFPFRYRFGMSGAFGDGLPSSRGPVQIGNDDGAVIGARAVVTRDVRPYVIVVGDPATEVRRRFDDDTVTRLLETAWWAWPDCVVRAATPLLSSDDLTAFFDFAANRQHPSRPTPTATQPSA
ncbi:MAG TPA: hypothetical protein VGR26_13555 [Acidimicrobiales bacterium]|nr:hypothetical protein [Acidimicrobiales bacterium]